MIDFVVVAGWAAPSVQMNGSWWIHAHARKDPQALVVGLRLLGFHVGLCIIWRGNGT